jgi:nucleotide-binding universal stress UspA family protein
MAAKLVLFAYDGAELAEHAIKEAGRLLGPGRDALVVCVWHPADVGFVPVDEQHFNAQNAGEVEEAAQRTADHGALLAQHEGFNAKSLTVEAAPTWKGIVEAAKDHQSDLIVLGSHRRTGLVGQLTGSVAAAVVQHAPISVLITHEPG